MKIKCNSLSDVDLIDKIIVLKDKVLKKEYDLLQNHFYRAIGGFGCNPGAIGSAVFTKEMFGPMEERWDRYSFAGWMTDEEFATYCEENKIAWKILADGNEA
jgi:hypothetical protein